MQYVDSRTVSSASSSKCYIRFAICPGMNIYCFWMMSYQQHAFCFFCRAFVDREAKMAAVACRRKKTTPLCWINRCRFVASDHDSLRSSWWGACCIAVEYVSFCGRRIWGYSVSRKTRYVVPSSWRSSRGEVFVDVWFFRGDGMRSQLREGSRTNRPTAGNSCSGPKGWAF